jgi:hypothetical protein
MPQPTTTRIPGDPRERVVIRPGTTDWQDANNDNWVKTVAQVNDQEKRITETRTALADLQRRFDDLSRPYDFSVFVPGAPQAGVTVLRAVVPPDRYVHIQKGVVGAVSCKVAPATSVVFNVRIAEAVVGTVSISAGLTRGQVVFTQSITLEPFASLEIEGPGAEDQTMVDLAITITAGSLRKDEVEELINPCA